MARKSASNPSMAGLKVGGMPDDAGALLNDWLAQQNSLLGAGLAQITGSQMAILSSWLELQNALARQWQEQAANVIQLAVDDWWSPWSPFWQRGGEQLA